MVGLEPVSQKGFETRMAMPGPDGGIMHAEMQVQDGVIMMSPTGDSASWTSPKAQGGRVTQSLYIYVDDVDAHYRRALAAGATCVEPQENHGSRMYRAVDLEGHRWIFSQRSHPE